MPERRKQNRAISSKVVYREALAALKPAMDLARTKEDLDQIVESIHDIR